MAAAINLPLVSLCKSPRFVNPSTSFLQRDYADAGSVRRSRELKSYRKRGAIVCGVPLGVDPWAPTIDSQSIASQLFALSLFPYVGFLYFITKSKTSPNLTLFGFYFLLAFVGATIPAGIYGESSSLSEIEVELDRHKAHGVSYSCLCLVAWHGMAAKVHYGTSLSNVDWLHGGAESLLALTNLFIVLGLRRGLRKAGNSEQNTPTPDSGLKEEKKGGMRV